MFDRESATDIFNIIQINDIFTELQRFENHQIDNDTSLFEYPRHRESKAGLPTLFAALKRLGSREESCDDVSYHPHGSIKGLEVGVRQLQHQAISTLRKTKE